MSPLGKFTLALLGLRFFGAAGLFWGLFLGHILIDRTSLIKLLEKQLNIIDDNIRLVLPYKFYRYYNRIDGNFWGKIWGIIFGSILFGTDGFIAFFIIGHFVFDTPNSRNARIFRSRLDEFFNQNLYKILGGIIGFGLQSPILLFSGVILGFFADWYLAKKQFRPQFSFFKIPFFKANPLKLLLNLFPARRNSLLQSMAGLAAKIAKADGQVSEKEIRVFKKMFDSTEISNRYISKTFNKAKNSCDGYECYARQIRRLTKDDLVSKENVMENLFKIALADGAYSDKELEILTDIADIIELPRGNFNVIKQSFEPKVKNTSNVKDFYEVLGVFCNASDKEIKCRWKELINIYHPDRIQADGGSIEEVEKTTIKMAEINNAYQNIMKSRKAA